MKKSKEELIAEYMLIPPQRGEMVKVRGFGSRNPEQWGSTHVASYNPKTEEITISKGYGYRNETETISKENWEKDPFYIGSNPFAEKPWNADLRIVAFDLDNILTSVGFERRKVIFKNDVYGNIEVPELNWDPILINENGEEIKYQRNFCWTLKDKQLLIDSIYNNIDIGKIVIRKRSWDYVESRIKKGIIKNTSFKDIVDGKQRLNAIITFIQNEYPDSNGNYYEELSESSKRKFGRFQGIAYGELGEKMIDKDVKNIFLNINFTGVPMSQDHIEFVKTINI